MNSSTKFDSRVNRSSSGLAYEIENLGRRVYADMPPAVLIEPARNQFVQALIPDELRLHVQFGHPASLGAALDCAIEEETTVCATRCSPSIAVAAVTEVPDQGPAQVDQLIRAAQVQAAQLTGTKGERHPPVCCVVARGATWNQELFYSS